MDDEGENGGRIRIRQLGGGRRWGWLRGRWVKALAALAGLVLLGWLAIWLVFARDLPSADTLLSYEPPLPTNIRDVNGNPLYTYARERRVELGFDEFPPLLVSAFVSAEDKNFFSHHGVNPLTFANGAFEYVTKMGSGERARGGSTITQQVAKNLLVGDEYSVRRKVREAILAIRIEMTLTKPQIMELYLNQIFLGRNAYGVEAAAQAYFGKDVRGLTLPEMAYLAILPKAPSNYTPEHDLARALERRSYVLREMRANGYITAAQQAEADAAPLGTVPRAAPRQDRAPGYFTEEVRRELIDKFGENAAAGPYSVYAGGLWVRTSFDAEKQAAAEQALRDGLMRYDAGRGWSGPSRHIEPGEGWQGRLLAANVGAGYADWKAAVVLAKQGGAAEIGFENGTTASLPAWAAALPKRGVGGRAFDFLKPGDVIVVKQVEGSWTLRSLPVISGGMVIENPHTGQILAMQGGWDFRGNSFNRATQALRQPGSSFKPFVYAAALDNGMTPASIIVDGPFCVYQSAALGTKCFRNFSGGYAGPKTMRWGVEQSRNLMTVRAAAQTGMGKIVALAKRVGIGTYPPVLAIALGAGETTVQRMVSGFSTIDNQGRRIPATLIDFVQDRRGKVIWRADERPCERCNMPDWDGQPMPRPGQRRGSQAIDPLTAYQVLHILEGVVQRGTATVLRDLNRPLFGKTGTTTGPTNVWFVGGSADLVGGVYIGYDKPRPLGGFAQGGTIAAPIFKQFAEKAMADMPVVPFVAPPGIRMVRIDRITGRRVYGGWPGSDPKAPIIWEAFKPETEPRRTIQRGPVSAGPAAAPPAPRDSDFLQRQGGIY
ncbi:penicillin-binding protein 1A [Sphingomonas morindae]|uniref:Penicillin-binding protein 1A n=1 Tax=Sphingomonas morindae TaxID=1541170 RepID=A0ABY4X3A5_9SPHN|nr:transglycosylase domain-containing protein [Sphingomonas morindae]USI71376.1 transglycosylase domain-containing protein [Sphingomonas morindae]